MHLNMRRSFDPIRIPGIAIDEDENREVDPGYSGPGQPGPGYPGLGSDYRDQDPYNLKTTYESNPLSTYLNPRDQPPPRTFQEPPVSRYESQTDPLSTHPKPQPQPRSRTLQETSPISGYESQADPVSTYLNPPKPQPQPRPPTLQEESPISRYESQTDPSSTYLKTQPQPRPPIIQEESPLSVSLPVSGAEKVRLPVENKTVPIPAKGAVPASLESSIADLADIMQVIKGSICLFYDDD
jgi:hypothetical protein